MTATESATGPWDASGLHSAGRLPMRALRRVPDIALDGTWDFQLLPTPTSPLGPDWKKIQVPGLWTMREDLADGDVPHYTNVPMPFDEVPPQVPADNPTGVYRRVIQLSPVPGRRTLLHVGAASGLLRVVVNDRPIGSSSDSHLAAEFDITDAVVPGTNRIDLRVAKWSAASYLEDQDHWWQSGLTRPVFLYSLPGIALADVAAVADYDPGTGRGDLHVDVSTTGLDHLYDTGGWSVRIEVLDRSVRLPVSPRLATRTLPLPSLDRSVRPEPLLPDDFMDLLSINAAGAPVPPEFRAIPATMSTLPEPDAPAGRAAFSLPGLPVTPWSAEIPHLEDLTVHLVAPDGSVADEARVRIGFRRVRIEGRDLLVNGERVLIQGVARHDVDPRTGRVMSRERHLAELSLLKRFNVNAIRTSHYPNDPEVLDLCDELGLYVIDEADVEGHAFASTIADDPAYLAEIVERVSRMVLRDRNHPSVISWSLGNETGHGAAHDAAAGWIRRFDPTRPLHYEGAISTDWHAGHTATDILCPMYPSMGSLTGYSADPRADRPLITCEYAFSMGNGTGGLSDYWELFESLPGLQGGFIWQFTDHSLDRDGDGKLRYGGDFGDDSYNGPMLANGVVFPDLTPKPALFEARGIFSPVRVVSDAEEARAGTLRIRNRQSFADLGAYTLELRVETPAGPAGAVTVPTPEVAAGAEGTIAVPAAVHQLLTAGPVLALTLTVRTREDALWAPAGTEIAAGQVTFPQEPVRLPAAPALRPVLSLDGEGNLVHPLLRGSPRLGLWRAPTCHDMSFSLDNRFVRSGFFQLTPVDTEVKETGDGAVVTTRYEAAFGDEVIHRRTITALAEGDWVLNEQVTLPEGTRDGLRVGMEFELVDGFAHADWVGLGPWENYPDRRASALLGAWRSPIDELAVPYLLPQENGTRGEVTALSLTGPAGTVRTTHPTPLHMNVGRYRVSEIEAAEHWWELPPSDNTVVHLDIAHRGLGTAVLGPDTHPRHRLTGSAYAWEWRLTLSASG
ncbi:glycoside hydrolase family 2 TIM barrel-domain containing protein [Streptomyces sp. NPDC093109]|uniref:glycoside hydrolase family 2 TIM barrel-domain containing protein n=1 Tax=Streptomyces sp. NPDC093109 TaxID=3154977 RepID=UPI00344DDD1E